LKTTTYTLVLPGAPTLTLAHLADLHCFPGKKWLRLLEKASPDIILSTGDMMQNTGKVSVEAGSNRHGLEFLSAAAEIAPLYYSLGNHENGMSEENRQILAVKQIHLLDNAWCMIHGLVIGGLSSTIAAGMCHHEPTPLPTHDFLSHYAAIPGFHLLLCHHPEFWTPAICGTGIQLTLSGHAHGGQWHLFGRDIFAPGQGIFPRYASGMHKDRDGSTLVVSRGMSNTVSPIPRIGNPCEMVILHIQGESK